jgi:hypothetical protein
VAGRQTKTGSSGRNTRAMHGGDLREGQLADRIKRAVNAALEQVAEDSEVDIAEIRRLAKERGIIG